MAREWTSLTMSNSPKGYSGLLAVCVTVLVAWAQIVTPTVAAALTGLILIAAIGAMMIKANLFKNAGWWLVGIGYVGMPMIAMWWLRTLDAGQMVLWLFFIVWATDIGGYVFGKSIGGPKLAPKLSPKKTWAGLLGGMAFSVAVGVGLQLTFGIVSTMVVLVIASGLLAVWAQAGDLLESGIKRHFGVKDSGELIPGHGGLLDRVDGLVFVAPAMALLVVFFPSLFAAGV